MKRFLCICFVFIGVLFCVLWVIQFRMDTVGLNRATQMRRVRQCGINADLVVFGNSRAQVSYNTVLMDSVLGWKCYNLGLSGRPFDFQYMFMIKPYLSRNIKPRAIIQEVSPHAFFRHWNPVFDYDYLPYLQYPEYDYYIQQCEDVSKIDKYLPIKYRGIRFGKLAKLYKDWAQDTISEYQDGYTPIADTICYRNDFNASKYYFEEDKEMINMMHTFIRSCDTDSIRLFLVISPMHKDDYYSHCEMERFKLLLDSLMLGSNATLLDYSMMYGNDTILMKDPTHMSYTGSCVFSRKLASDIRCRMEKDSIYCH